MISQANEHDESSSRTNKDLTVSNIDKRVFGFVLEHMVCGAVCTGIYEPGHETTDTNGFRQDALDYVRNLDMPIVH